MASNTNLPTMRFSKPVAPSPSTPSAEVWRRFAVEHIPSTTEVVIDLLERAKDTQTVIELGCGTGKCLAAVSLALKPRFFVGIDVNFDAVRLANKLKPPTPPACFVNADANVLPFRDNAFDLAMAQAFFTVVPTLEERSAILNEIRRVLQPGGFLYIGDFLLNTTSTAYQRRYALGYELTGEYGTFPVAAPDGSVLYFAHHFAKDEPGQMLEAHGFSVKRQEATPVKTYSGQSIEGFALLAQLKS